MESSRKRPSGGAALYLHQEAQCPPPVCKRRCREEQEEEPRRQRGRVGGSKENTDPQRRISRTRSTETATTTWVRSGSGFRGVEVQSRISEVRVAVIRKTRTQTCVHADLHRGSHQDQKDRRVQDRSTNALRSTFRIQDSSETWTCRVPDPEGSTTPSFKGRVEAQKRRSKRKIHPSMFRGRGQLRLSIKAEAGQLFLHIKEARGLMEKTHKSCDSYVTVTVTSDPDHSIRMKTDTIQNNRDPEYNRTFILSISDHLFWSRLLVSVFRRRHESRCSQLIGCMSFGIGSLISSSKHITGWFYLLGEEFGRSKHLRVTSALRSSSCELRKTPDSGPDLDHLTSATDQSDHRHVSTCPPANDITNSALNQDVSKQVHLKRDNQVHLIQDSSNQVHLNQDSKQLTVNIVRGTNGFGFTICSDCPVRVQAVDTGGPAHHAGLQQGDSVLQLNGVQVEAWKCSDLAQAIRSCPSHIVLIVWRGLSEGSSESGCKVWPHPHPQTHPSATGRKLLPPPLHSKRSRGRSRGSGVRSSLGALGSLWRDKKGEEEEEEEEYIHQSSTLKGTRVTSSNGDNYIILSPVDAGSQLLQPVYHNRNGTIGRLYQTHPSRGRSLLHEPPPPFTSPTATLPPAPTSTSAISPLSNYGNYQNCTIVQSHLPCSGYGPYMTLPPKTLIFPVFVQPLDLCSPDRTLLMSEEMLLHQAHLRPSKVTVLVYTDLLLLTREEEVGRCNVLQSPVYLNTLQLREVSSQPLHIYLLQTSQNICHSLFSLEAFSVQQKLRLSLCLHDNIQQQLLTAEPTAGPQRSDLLSDFHLLSPPQHSDLPSDFHLLSPPQHSDLPSDFHLLSLGQSDLHYGPASPFPLSDPPLLCSSSLYSSLCGPLRPPSPYSSSSPPLRAFTPPPLRSPLWKERGGSEGEEEERRRRQEEENERQQGEGESASETSENLGSGRGLLLSPTHFMMKEEEEEDSWDEEEEEERGGAELKFSRKPAVLRRSLSEGSLSLEPRSPRFLSDSTIHRLTRPMTFDPEPHQGSAPRRPSIYTLKRQLTREGGTLHHMMLLLNGTKTPRTRRLKRTTHSLAADVRSRLAFLRQRKNIQSINSNSLEKALRNNRPSTGEVLRWAESLEALLTNQYGVAVFRHFLRSEFSEENLDFWLAVERFKKTRPLKMAAKAAKICDEFISTNAARQINVDSTVREATNHSLSLGISPASFQLAQDQIFGLMEADSYPRFLKSHLYTQLANQSQT